MRTIDDITYSLDEMAAILHCHPASVKRWVKQGKIPPPIERTKGYNVKWLKTDVNRWFDAGTPFYAKWNARGLPTKGDR